MYMHRDFVAKIFFRVNTSTELLRKISEFGCALGNTSHGCKFSVVNTTVQNALEMQSLQEVLNNIYHAVITA